MTASADYDTPRQRPTMEDGEDDSWRIPRAGGADIRSGAVAIDETDLNEAELPGADLSNLLFEQELSVRVVHMQADEFTCSHCFLIYPRARLAPNRQGRLICRDCA